jgi:hypothetical protein
MIFSFYVLTKLDQGRGQEFWDGYGIPSGRASTSVVAPPLSAQLDPQMREDVLTRLHSMRQDLEAAVDISQKQLSEKSERLLGYLSENDADGSLFEDILDRHES